MGNKGMMTVEASVVVPIILIIVVAEFFFGLFLIDMSVVKSETMRLADEAAVPRLRQAHQCVRREPCG